MPVPRMQIDDEGDDHVSFSFKEDCLYDDEDDGLVDITEEEEVAGDERKEFAKAMTGPAICEASDCSKVASYRCSRCESAWYCSAKCQRSAWKKYHRNACVPVSDDATKKRPQRKKKVLGDGDKENPPAVPEEDIVIEASCDPHYASGGNDQVYFDLGLSK